MDTQQHRQYGGIIGVRGYLVEHDDVLADINATPARQTLDDVILAIGELAPEQDPIGHRRNQAGAVVRAARAEIRERWMKPISSIARSARLKGDREELRKLRLGDPDIGVATFIAQGRAMAGAARGYASTFVTAGLPADFADQLEAAIDVLGALEAERRRVIARRKGATVAIREQLARGLAAVRTLAAVVELRIAADDRLRGEWSSTIRAVSKPRADQRDRGNDGSAVVVPAA
jgi:hypothetical protein